LERLPDFRTRTRTSRAASTGSDACRRHGGPAICARSVTDWDYRRGRPVRPATVITWPVDFPP
jgi:hypothetical protein